MKIALDGVVRSIDDLPELQKPELRSVEGSEAVIEAFRRLSNTAIALVAHGKAPPSPEEIRKTQVGQPSGLEAAFTQDKAGLSDRDYIPLMIAIFVDVCILLVSVNRPFGPFFNLGQGLSRARRRGPMQGVLETFYGVFQDQFHLQRGESPPPGDLIAPLQDVVFDYKGDYYAAVPLDFREENYDQWAKERMNAPSFESSRALERSRYLAAVFAVLEGQKLVRLLGEEKKGRFGGGGSGGLDEATVRVKLDKQGSMYAQADAFRIYRFQPGKWAGLLIETVGSAAARQDADRRWREGEGEVWWLAQEQAGADRAARSTGAGNTRPCSGTSANRRPASSRTARITNRLRGCGLPGQAVESVFVSAGAMPDSGQRGRAGVSRLSLKTRGQALGAGPGDHGAVVSAKAGRRRMEAIAGRLAFLEKGRAQHLVGGNATCHGEAFGKPRRAVQPECRFKSVADGIRRGCLKRGAQSRTSLRPSGASDSAACRTAVLRPEKEKSGASRPDSGLGNAKRAGLPPSAKRSTAGPPGNPGPVSWRPCRRLRRARRRWFRRAFCSRNRRLPG